ncbi:GGDEF domain-containing protein [Rhizobacter sp. AJA081-3]|uniref:GGDEF domain-containing protein n=1 Tax=Rhizobacter sp. AJA081-3 TaxID=2753607 RepID=UPI001AE08D6D|nr:GGDEF domain-containing protein [Rhizobacter sp. AJA081-3]QTN22985.1 GGDEF domain-containing protein [Rhizobacter sp. AJA081-3]
MSTSAPVITTLVSLVAMQFMLYATGWLLSSLLLRDERTAVLCWAGFMACIGLGFVLTSQRGEPRTWLAFNGSGVAFIAGLLLLWIGLAAFYRRPRPYREPLITFVLLAGLLAWMGAGVEQAPARVLLTYGADMWITLRLMTTIHSAVRADHGQRLALTIASPALLIIAAFAVPFSRQLMNLDQPMEVHRFDEANLRSLYVYMVAAAVFNFGFMAVVTHRLLARLRDLSHRDALTGLFNRRAIEQELQREWRRWRRRRDGFALLSIDLDHFKQINDTHGHAGGDQVLIETSRRLLAHARDTDTVARTGGEEFLVLLPCTDLQGAALAGERLLVHLRHHPITLAGVAVQATASIGIAQVMEGDADIAAALTRADRALYRAKTEGRDRLVLAD